MIRFLLAFAVLIMMMARASAQTAASPATDVQLSEYLAHRSDLQECGAASLVPLQNIPPLLRCLEAHGSYVTAIRIATLTKAHIQDMRLWVVTHFTGDFNTLQQGEDLTRKLDEDLRMLNLDIGQYENEQKSKPQLPDEVEQHADTCESKVVKAKLSDTDTYFVIQDSFGESDDALDKYAEHVIGDAASVVPIATCYFSQKDWRGAHLWFKKLDSDTVMLSYGKANFEWHMAIIAEKTGDIRGAKNHIRQAESWSIGEDSQLANQIRFDYNRLGAAKEDAIAADHSYRQDMADLRAERNAFAAKYSGDMREVANEQGVPCHIETFNGGTHYHQVTWWYCHADGAYEKAFTFLNGVLRSTYEP